MADNLCRAINKRIMNFVKLTDEKLDINSISELVTDESCGAVSIFVGMTRDNFEDKQVSGWNTKIS